MASTVGGDAKSAASGGAKDALAGDVGPVGWPEVPQPEPSVWPEWNDADINAEKWDLPKAAKPKKETPKSKTSSATSVDEIRQFEDPEPVLLPASIYPSSTGWRRPQEIFTDKVVKMYDDRTILADLVTPNKHLTGSEWMRDLMTSISTLQYIGYTHGFTIECESPTYSPNTVAWQPWHHVYSMCKAGKGQAHKPQVNTLGKYVVRVFHMGVWRKITVDDRLPIDAKGQVLLPGTSTEDSVEMWPYLLVKALLKIASSTWTMDREIVDYSTVTCLTGWVFQHVDVAGLDVNEIWDMCVAYSSHYTWPEDPPIEENLSKVDKSSKKSDKTEKSGKKPPSMHNLIPTYLFGTCEDMTTASSELVPNITPCWSHSFFIEQTRDIPLENPGEPRKLEPWKHYRWESWAIEKGILVDERKKIPLKYFKMISFFKQVSDFVKYTPPSFENAVNKDASNTNAKNGKNTVSDKTGKKGDGDAPVPHPDPSIWGDFNQLKSHIFRLCIYFKPSAFKTNFKITNLLLNAPAPVGKSKGPPPKSAPPGAEESHEPIVLRWPHTLVRSRNEPLYVFMDSLDFKFLVITLSHQSSRFSLNDIEKMEKRKSLIKRNSTFRTCSRKSVLSQSAASQSAMHRRSVSIQDNYEDKLNDMKAVYNKPCENCSIIVEEYDWRSLEIGEMVFKLKSYGISTSLIDLAEGRYVLRLWIKSSNNYFLNILSDTAITIGSFDMIALKMSDESHRTLFKIHDICQKFGHFYSSVGNKDYRTAKIDFCKCYKPDLKCEINFKKYIHDVFKDELKDILKQNCADLMEYNYYLRILGILFLQPEFPKNYQASSQNSLSIADLYLFIKYIEQIEKKIELFSQDPEKFFENESNCSDLPTFTPYEAAVIIQSFFKQKYIGAIMSFHNRNNKESFKEFKDGLLQIYEKLFSLNNRTTQIEKLLRNFVENPKIQELIPYYTFLNDFSNTICFQEFNGIIEDLKSDSWVFMTRLTFNLLTEDSIFLKINLYCNLQTYFLRIFDNDSNIELPRYTNNVLPQVFHRNNSGYTVLGYGWTTSNIQYTSTIWKLIFVRMKTKITEHVLNIIQPTFNHEIIVRNYIPNFYNYVCRCLIKVTQSCHVTVRLQLSYPQAKFVLKCKSNTDEILHEVQGTGSLIIPVLFLKSDNPPIDDHLASTSHITIDSKPGHSKRSSPRSPRNSEKTKSKQPHPTPSIKELVQSIYVIEAIVLNNSWPLTNSEWAAVEHVKRQGLLNIFGDDLNSNPSVADSATHIRFKNRKNPNESIEPPSWMLEVVSNSNDNVIVERDTRREEEIRAMKQSWEENEPGRALKAHIYRVKLLESNVRHVSLEGGSTVLAPIHEGQEMSSELSKISMTRSLKHVTSSTTKKRSARGIEDHSAASMSSALSKRSRAHSLNEPNNSKKSLVCIKNASAKDIFIKSSTVINENEIRTLKPVNNFKFSEPLNLSLYERNAVYKAIEDILYNEMGGDVVPEERRWVKNISTEDILKESRERRIHLSERRQDFYLVEIERFTNTHVKKFNRLLTWFYEGREVSVELVQSALRERSKSIINYLEMRLEQHSK